MKIEDRTEPVHLYSQEFFQNHWENSLRSARLIAPIVYELIKPQSVVDFGCGWGAWLKAWQELGVSEIRGIDGDYIDRSKLLFDPGSFEPADLCAPIALGRRYDLALCLEVAEHLPPQRAAGLVADLVKVAPVLMFSAAIPGQPGVGHINPRWPAYWAELFAEHGYRRVDALRPQLCHQSGVDYFYRQNLVLYLESEALDQFPALASIAERQGEAGEEWVYAPLYQSVLMALEGPVSMRRLLREFPGAVVRVIGRFVNGLLERPIARANVLAQRVCQKSTNRALSHSK